MSIADLRNKAKRALLDGKYKRALGFFEELHKADPGDVRTHVKLAELREKTGDTATAVKDYLAIAHAYAEQGFVVQAIAINKIILRLDPSQTEVKDRLKELSDERGDDWAISTISATDQVKSADISSKDHAKLSFERTPLLSGLAGEELEAFMDSGYSGPQARVFSSVRGRFLRRTRIHVPHHTFGCSSCRIGL